MDNWLIAEMNNLLEECVGEHRAEVLDHCFFGFSGFINFGCNCKCFSDFWNFELANQEEKI